MTARSHLMFSAPTVVLAAVLVASAVLAGCSLSRPAPVKQTFLIESAAPPVVAKTQPGTLRVRAFNVGSPFRGKAFVYRETDLKYEADFYAENSWLLRQPCSGEAPRVHSSARGCSRQSPQGAADGNYLLDAFVDASTATPAAAALRSPNSGDLYCRARTRDARPLLVEQYRKTAPVAAKTPEALRRRCQSCLAITAELARDLAALELRTLSL
jgi:hypothetical protein